MNNFARLYRFELKKILSRKITWIVFAGIFVLVMGSNIAEYVVCKKSAECNETALIGRQLDDSLFEEMRAGITPSFVTDEQGDKEIEYVKYDDNKYRHLYQFLINCCGNTTKAYYASGADMNKRFSEIIDYAFDDQKLNADEISYWQNRMKNEQIPPLYDVSAGWSNSIVNLCMTNFFILITIGASLSGVFADEYSRRTDAIVFASGTGKKKLSVIKIMAGCTVGIIEAFLIVAMLSCVQFILYGFVDSNASIQLTFGPSAIDMPAKKAFLICFGIILLMSVFYSVFTMLISQIFQNTTVPVALMAFLLICSMLNPPNKYRLIAQIASYMPATFPGSWTFTDYRLLNIFGLKLNVFQVLPILYVLLIAIIMFLIYQSYSKTQIKGR